MNGDGILFRKEGEFFCNWLDSLHQIVDMVLDFKADILEARVDDPAICLLGDARLASSISYLPSAIRL